MEYNKIHALAQARRKVLTEFGTDLLSYWPLTGPGPVQRDLLRQRVLIAEDDDDLDVQSAGLLDYACRLPEKVMATVATGAPDYTSQTPTLDQANKVAIVLPAGVWKKIKFKSRTQSGSQAMYIAKPALDGDEDAWVTRCMMTGSTVVSGPGVNYLHTWTLPNPIVVENEGDLWCYVSIVANKVAYKSGENNKPNAAYWNGGAQQWQVNCELIWGVEGDDAETWSSYDDLTLGVILYAEPGFRMDANARSVAITPSTAVPKVSLYWDDGKPKAEVRNTDDTLYTLTGSKVPHPGANLYVISYDRNVKVKFYINGVLDQEATPSDHPMLNVAATVSLGGTATTVGAVGWRQYDCKASDLFIAKAVVADAKIREIYEEFITAAPLMLTTSV